VSRPKKDGNKSQANYEHKYFPDSWLPIWALFYAEQEKDKTAK
jgi:hypothetical protein